MNMTPKVCDELKKYKNDALYVHKNDGHTIYYVRENCISSSDMSCVFDTMKANLAYEIGFYINGDFGDDVLPIAELNKKSEWFAKGIAERFWSASTLYDLYSYTNYTLAAMTIIAAYLGNETLRCKCRDALYDGSLTSTYANWIKDMKMSREDIDRLFASDTTDAWRDLSKLFVEPRVSADGDSKFGSDITIILNNAESLIKVAFEDAEIMEYLKFIAKCVKQIGDNF